MDCKCQKIRDFENNKKQKDWNPESKEWTRPVGYFKDLCDNCSMTVTLQKHFYKNSNSSMQLLNILGLQSHMLIIFLHKSTSIL